MRNSNRISKHTRKLTVDQLLVLFDRWKSALESLLMRFAVLPFDGRRLLFGTSNGARLDQASVRGGRITVFVVHEFLVLALLIVRTGAGCAQIATWIGAQNAAGLAELTVTIGSRFVGGSVDRPVCQLTQVLGHRNLGQTVDNVVVRQVA